ncbi:deoxyribonuclease IV [Candidatus Zixiibacteriota bacterium]
MMCSKDDFFERPAEPEGELSSDEALLDPLPEFAELQEKSPLRAGAHMSIAGRIYESVDRAVSYGCDCMQIFSRSPRTWKAKELTEEDAAEFCKRRQHAGIDPVAVHIPYLVNLCSPDPALHARSATEFAADLLRAARIEADYFVTHVGSHKEAGQEIGLIQISTALRKIFGEDTSPVLVLLENTAGSANSMGHNFEQLQAIIEAVDSPGRLGICLDTAHAFEAGYDLATSDGLEGMLEDLDRWIGIEHLKIIHANDSKTAYGSHSDRHEHIGMGQIGLDAFRNIVNHPQLRGLPFILETPQDDLGGFEMDLAVLRALRQGV